MASGPTFPSLIQSSSGRQPLLPEAERALRHRVRDLGDRPAAAPVRRQRHTVHEKVGHDGTGVAVVVAVEEVPRVRRLMVDRLLDQTQAECLRVEVVVVLSARYGSRDVVQPFKPGSSLGFWRRRPPASPASCDPRPGDGRRRSAGSSSGAAPSRTCASLPAGRASRPAPPAHIEGRARYHPRSG